MSNTFSVGDHVSWNSEAGRIRGHIQKIHTADFDFMGRTRRASKEEPQYEVQSEKTLNLAAHKGSALRQLKSD